MDGWMRNFSRFLFKFFFGAKLLLDSLDFWFRMLLMKIIAVNKSSDTVPYLVCTCRDFSINEETSVLEIILANEPYRTDFPAEPDKIVIHPDNYDWVDQWPLDEEGVEELKVFRRK